MRTATVLCSGLLIFLLCGCDVLRQSSKTGLHDAYYTQKIDGEKTKVYLDEEEDTIRVYRMDRVNGRRTVDTSAVIRNYPVQMFMGQLRTARYCRNSFDLDFLIMPLKLRPAISGVPMQLNSTLTGSLYLGFRKDDYVISYDPDPLYRSLRYVDHFGFSIGGFAGLGNTFMSATSTGSSINNDYDGVVFCKGIAVIIAVNNFTVGLATGADNLLDSNKRFWIYENKPWFGLTFGLNLN